MTGHTQDHRADFRPTDTGFNSRPIPRSVREFVLSLITEHCFRIADKSGLGLKVHLFDVLGSWCGLEAFPSAQNLGPTQVRIRP
jgi:hypothetical protein